MRQTDLEFFEERVHRPETPCWNWRSYINRRGYGTWRRDGRDSYVHRIAYELFVGVIPEGLEVHHTCCNRSCVNPDHLELVTHAENIALIDNKRKAYCPKGHPFDETNTYISPKGNRQCKTCRRAATKAAHEKRRRAAGMKDLSKTCKNGHERTPENTIVTTMKDGRERRRCRICREEQSHTRRKPAGYKNPARERATHCPQGHEFTPENTYEYERNGRKYRYCRECNRAAARRRSSPGVP